MSGNESKGFISKIDIRLKRYTKTIKELEIGSYWYRRLVHSCGIPVILGFFLLANESWLQVVRSYGPPIGVAIFVGMDVLRLAGFIPQKVFYGMREYEQRRPMGFTYFACAALILIMLAQYEIIPQAITVSCLLAGGIVDVGMGEARQARGRHFGMPVGFIIGTLLFWLVGFNWYLSLIGGFLAMLGESIKSFWIDDDFLLPMLPALGFIFCWQAGLPVPLGDVIVSIPLANWAYIDMSQFSTWGTVLGVVCIIGVIVTCLFFGLRRSDRVNASQNLFPILLFLMIMPIFIGAIMIFATPEFAQEKLIMKRIGAIMIFVAGLTDYATIKDMFSPTKKDANHIVKTGK